VDFTGNPNALPFKIEMEIGLYSILEPLDEM
jgi:hypothetical protein